MTTNLADITKTDLAAEVDRLRAENTELAARPCLACALAPQRCEQIEDTLHGALLLLDRVDMSELAATPRWSDWTEFEAERAELWATYNRLVRGQN